MRGLLRESMVIGGLLIFAFLALTHFTGFEKDIRSIATAGIGGTKALQGR